MLIGKEWRSRALLISTLRKDKKQWTHMKFYLKMRKLFLLSNTEMGCPERLWSLHLWRYWKPNWMWSCVTCCGRPCLDRGHGLSDLQKFLPIFNNNSHRRSICFQMYHLKIKRPRTKMWRNRGVCFILPALTDVGHCNNQTFSFSTVWFHLILNSVFPVLLWIHVHVWRKGVVHVIQ